MEQQNVDKNQRQYEIISFRFSTVNWSLIPTYAKLQEIVSTLTLQERFTAPFADILDTYTVQQELFYKRGRNREARIIRLLIIATTIVVVQNAIQQDQDIATISSAGSEAIQKSTKLLGLQSNNETVLKRSVKKLCLMLYELRQTKIRYRSWELIYLSKLHNLAKVLILTKYQASTYSLSRLSVKPKLHVNRSKLELPKAQTKTTSGSLH